MSSTIQDRHVRRRLAVLRHADQVTGNVAMTCRYYGISRQNFYVWKRRYDDYVLEKLPLQVQEIPSGPSRGG